MSVGSQRPTTHEPLPFDRGAAGEHSVRLLCHVLDMPANGYYDWQQAHKHVTSIQPAAWQEALVNVFSRHHSRYGTRRS
jgi:putative transposase